MGARWLIPIGLIAVIVVSGCTSNSSPVYSGNFDGNNANQPNTASQPPTSPPTTQTSVATLTLYLPIGKSWDADPEVDGVEVHVAPKDSSDNLVKADGFVDAMLWKREIDVYSQDYSVKGDLIGQWFNIPIRKVDYESFSGATVRLGFSNYEPSSMESGILEVNFTTGGKTFGARSSAILRTS